jgi:hypothetical protein
MAPRRHTLVWPAKTEGFALAVQQILFNGRNSIASVTPTGAIAGLNKDQTARPESQRSAEKTKNSQNEHGGGNLRGQRKAGKPAFILLTREIHSGLKWVEVD